METNTDGNIAGSIPPNAVSVYGQTADAMDEFPVLKAFQQYIDAEQAKARKRLISLGIFFAILTGAVIAVFVSLLIGIERRNQTLNDRLIEYAMRDRQSAAPAVQPQQDNTMMMMLTSKLEELQNKLKESQEKMDNAAKVAEERKAAAEASANPPSPTKQDLEIERLKLQLAAEKEKAAVEKERRRQAELEEYRRKHYPELYEQPKALRQVQRRKAVKIEDDELDDDDAINYFDDDDEDEEEQVKPTARKPAKPAAKPKAKPYTIPVEVRGTKSNWKLPD